MSFATVALTGPSAVKWERDFTMCSNNRERQRRRTTQTHLVKDRLDLVLDVIVAGRLEGVLSGAMILGALRWLGLGTCNSTASTLLTFRHAFM